MHDELYAHLVGCIYTDVVINSHRLTSTPSQFLQDLLRQPTRFTTRDQQSYQLDSFLHFINVEGEQKKEANGSSFNVQEANAVEALVLALIARPGVVKKDIGVMTGYKGQKRVMRDMAKANGWADIKLLSTVDASQGNEFKIVILTLVSDKGLRKLLPQKLHRTSQQRLTLGIEEFMGQQSRANVGTSRQQEALYIIGNQRFWWTMPMVGKRSHNKNYMYRILRHMDEHAQKAGRSFVVHHKGYQPR